MKQKPKFVIEEKGTVKKNQATAEVFFTAFKALKSKEQEAFLEKVLKDERLSEDLLDIALIKKAKKIKGTPFSAKEYFARRRRTGSVS